MKTYRHICIALLAGCAITLMPGCTTSVFVNQWSDQSFHGPALNRILVIAVRKDPVRRRVWEDAFIGELARHGVDATQSYRLFPDAMPDSTQIAGSENWMVWSAVSETPEPADAEAVHRDVVNLVTADLTRKGIIRKAREARFR